MELRTEERRVAGFDRRISNPESNPPWKLSVESEDTTELNEASDASEPKSIDAVEADAAAERAHVKSS